MWICEYPNNQPSQHQSRQQDLPLKTDATRDPGVEWHECTSKMRFSRIMHMVANLLDNIGDIKPGEGQTGPKEVH